MLSASRSPVATIQVNPGLRRHLSDLYETDAIFDKFECAVSGDGRHLATGTYNNAFQVRLAVWPFGRLSSALCVAGRGCLCLFV